MKVKLCPACNRPLPQDAIEATLPRVKRRIYRSIADAGAAGRTKWQIMDEIYGDQAGGGAMSADIIKVHVCIINKTLRPTGAVIRADGTGCYRLEPHK